MNPHAQEDESTAILLSEHEQKPRDVFALQMGLFTSILVALLSLTICITQYKTSNSCDIITEVNGTEPLMEIQLLKQQKNWCIDSPSWEGYIMQDGSACWTVGEKLYVKDHEFQDENHTQYTIEMDIQRLVADQKILILGDSLSRYMFNALKSVIVGDTPTFNWFKNGSHGQIVASVGMNTTLEWHWLPKADNVGDHLKQLKSAGKLNEADHTIIMFGIHEVAFNFPKRKEIASLFAQQLRTDYAPLMKEVTFQTAAPISLKYLKIVRPAEYHKYKTNYPDCTPTNMMLYNLHMAEELSKNGTHPPIKTMDGYWRFEVTDSDGMHSTVHAVHSSYRFLWRYFWLNPLENSIIQS